MPVSVAAMRHIRLLAALVTVCGVCLAAQADSKAKMRSLKDAARQGSSGISSITPMLSDEDVEVRREAVKALVQIGTQRSLEPLVTACRDNDLEVQVWATDGLVNFYLPGYVSHGFSASLKRVSNRLTARWNEPSNDDVVDPDTPIRPEIVKALSELAESGAGMESRANAARALGVLRARQAVPVLNAALKSKDSRLMFEALIALQKIRDRSAGARVGFLVRDLDPKVQAAAIETAGLLGCEDAVPDLERVFEDSPSKKIRRSAILALARIAAPSSRTLLRSVLADKDEEVRAAAAEGLGRIGRSEDVSALEGAWNDESKASPRLAVAFALTRSGQGSSGDLSPLGHLVNSLNQKAWRGVALPYLSELALQPGPRHAILAAASHANTADEKTGLAQALAGCRSADALPALETLAKDDDPAVAREALRALRILKGAL